MDVVIAVVGAAFVDVGVVSDVAVVAPFADVAVDGVDDGVDADGIAAAAATAAAAAAAGVGW